MKDFKGSKGKWSFSPQKGTKRHCYMAQIWCNGKSLAMIEPTDNEEEATANAKLMMSSKDLLNSLNEVVNAIENGKNEDNTYTQTFGESFIKKLKVVINKSL